MSVNDGEWVRRVRNVEKLLEIDGNGWEWLKWVGMVGIVGERVGMMGIG